MEAAEGGWGLGWVMRAGGGEILWFDSKCFSPFGLDKI